jgi:acetylornithine deacetylase/succinyl-diaminopimelate desuccinylase-like protein
MNSSQRLSLIVAICLLPVLAPSNSGGQEARLVISTEEETAREIAATPCKDGERLKAVKALFVKNGAVPEEVLIEKLDGVENLVIRKQGKSEETIVVGAHYDKTIDGCGAVDNWTGIVALAHIYRSLKNVSLQKSVIFVAFGKEEQGLLGSKAMVRRIKDEELARYCAMVNIDSLDGVSAGGREPVEQVTGRHSRGPGRAYEPAFQQGDDTWRGRRFSVVHGQENPGSNDQRDRQ